MSEIMINLPKLHVKTKMESAVMILFHLQYLQQLNRYRMNELSSSQEFPQEMSRGRNSKVKPEPTYFRFCLQVHAWKACLQLSQR